MGSTWRRDHPRRRLPPRLRRLPPLPRPRPPRRLGDPTGESLDRASATGRDSSLLENPPGDPLRRTVVLKKETSEFFFSFFTVSEESMAERKKGLSSN